MDGLIRVGYPPRIMIDSPRNEFAAINRLDDIALCDVKIRKIAERLGLLYNNRIRKKP